MAKRKAVSVGDLFGKPPAPAPTPAATAPTRSAARKSTPKSAPAGSDPLVSKAADKGKTRPVKTRDDATIRKEYAAYGKPISFRLPTKLDAEIERIAKSEGVGKTDLVRHILERFVSDHKRGAWPIKKQAKTYKIT